MPEWKQLITRPAGALPPNMIRTAGIVFVSVVLVGVVLSTLWTTGPENAVDVLPGTEPNVTGPGHVAQLTTRLTDLQDEQQRAQARAAEQAQRDADATQALAGLMGQGGAASAGLGGGVGNVNQGRPATSASGGGPGVVLTPDEIELRARLRLEGLERRARSLRAPAMVQTSRVPYGPDTAAPARRARMSGSRPCRGPSRHRRSPAGSGRCAARGCRDWSRAPDRPSRSPWPLPTGRAGVSRPFYRCRGRQRYSVHTTCTPSISSPTRSSASSGVARHASSCA